MSFWTPSICFNFLICILCTWLICMFLQMLMSSQNTELYSLKTFFFVCEKFVGLLLHMCVKKVIFKNFAVTKVFLSNVGCITNRPPCVMSQHSALNWQAHFNKFNQPTQVNSPISKDSIIVSSTYMHLHWSALHLLFKEEEKKRTDFGMDTVIEFPKP